MHITFLSNNVNQVQHVTFISQK